MAGTRLTTYLALRSLCAIALGAGTTVLVAWTISLRGINLADDFSGYDSSTHAVELSGGADALVIMNPDTGPGWSSTHLSIKRVHPSSTSTELLTIPEGLTMGSNIVSMRLNRTPSDLHPPHPPANSCTEYHFGWPAHAMWCTHESQVGGCMHTDRGTRRLAVLHRNEEYWGSGLERWRGAPPAVRAVPTGILPIGFALNTLTYTAAWCGLLFAPGYIRRTVRRRAHRCTHCGYALVGLTTQQCPECGSPTTR